MSRFRQRLYVVILATGSIIHPSSSQEADTVFLPELTISGVNEDRYALQSQRTRILVDSSGASALTDLLLQRLPIPINQHGARGQLASINLRGLGPSRTSLLWNNMEINSYTTGQSDLNLISPVGLGSISLQRGAASPLYGNGALGGTISLDSRSEFGQGVQLGLGQSLGSFGLSNTMLEASAGNEIWAGGVRGNFLSVDNDFQYKLNGEEVRQNNAAYESVNVMPYVAWLINASNSLKMDLWYSQNDRQVQPIKGDFTNTDYLQDRSWRGVINHYYDKGALGWESQVGYTGDWQVYNSAQPLIANRFFVASQVELELHKKVSTRVGFQANAINVSSEFHEDAREIRNDFFGSLTWSPVDKLMVNLNARQPMTQGQWKPFSPSLGVQWTAITKEYFQMGVNAEASRGFRLPTFNDRYWQPGGNADLLSETSNNLEAGFNGWWKNESVRLSGRSQFFRNDVDNWIIWIPGGQEVRPDGSTISFWYPDNVRRVLAAGLEFELEADWKLAENHRLHLRHSGSYTSATNETALNAFDRSQGKQLPYTPEHMHLSSLTYRWTDLQFIVSRSFTSVRFTEANNELPPLPSYTLYDLTVAKGWRLGAVHLSSHLTLRNITNQDYESFENRAMPGINFEFTLQAKYQLP